MGSGREAGVACTRSALRRAAPSARLLPTPPHPPTHTHTHRPLAPPGAALTPPPPTPPSSPNPNQNTKQPFLDDRTRAVLLAVVPLQLAANAALCERLGVRPPPAAEVSAAVAALEGAGLVESSAAAGGKAMGMGVGRGRGRGKGGGGAGASSRRVAPRVGMDAVRGALAGTRLLAACLED